MNSKELSVLELAKVMELTARGLAKGCINCVHFNGQQDIDQCLLNRQRIPARIVVVGCTEFRHNNEG